MTPIGQNKSELSQLCEELRQRRIRAWERQLLADCEEIQFQHRLKIVMPLIVVRPATGKHGSWDPLTRTIMISEQLIQSHPWDAVREVLKHELAHLIVTQRYGSSAADHGSEFQSVCEELGVAAWARPSSGPMPEQREQWRQAQPLNEEERLLRRVERLLALAQSSNEHEAHLAMQRVQELYARHNIERIRNAQTDEMVYTIINRKRKRMESYESAIYSILTGHFGVYVLFYKLFDAHSLEHHSVVEIMGRRADVLMAEYVVDFLTHQLKFHWERYQEKMGPGSRKSRNSYFQGILSGFSDSLEAQENKTNSLDQPAPSRALIVADKQALMTYTRSRYPRVQSRTWSSGYGDSSAFASGKREGRNIEIRRGMGASSGGTRALPAGR